MHSVHKYRLPLKLNSQLIQLKNIVKKHEKKIQSLPIIAQLTLINLLIKHTPFAFTPQVLHCKEKYSNVFQMVI